MKSIISFGILLLSAFAPLGAAERSVAYPYDPPRLGMDANVATGIDIAGDDMSSIDFNVSFGYRLPWIDFVGIGGGMNAMIANGSRNYPLYAIARSSFSCRPDLFFGEFRGGMSINRIEGMKNETGFFVQPGVGMYLSKSPKFNSHITMAYLYNNMRFPGARENSIVKGLNQMVLTVGLTL